MFLCPCLSAFCVDFLTTEFAASIQQLAKYEASPPDFSYKNLQTTQCSSTPNCCCERSSEFDTLPKGSSDCSPLWIAESFLHPFIHLFIHSFPKPRKQLEPPVFRSQDNYSDLTTTLNPFSPNLPPETFLNLLSPNLVYICPD